MGQRREATRTHTERWMQILSFPSVSLTFILRIHKLPDLQTRLRCKHLRLEESCFTNIQTKPDRLGVSEIHRHHIFVNCLFNVQEIVARIYPQKKKHLQWWSLSVLQQLVIHILILFLIFYRVATVVVISRRKLKAIVKLFALLYHTHDKYILKH